MLKMISLKAARVNAGMSRQEVADIMGVSYQTIKNWEDSIFTPGIAQVEMMCSLYDVDKDDIKVEPSKKKALVEE